jgi:protein phosphatase
MREYHRTHQGLVRASNQDNWLAETPLYGVADGMGGHRGGETASRVAVEVFKNAIGTKKPDPIVIRKAVEAANRRVYEMARNDENLSGMGTTMSMVWYTGEKLLIAHVGDSRIYRLRGGVLAQITEDHSFVADLVRKSVITPEMAKSHPYRNIITRAVGVDPVVEVDLLEEELQPDDLWLICSDGLHGMVEDEEICSILSGQEPEAACERLLARALENGGYDNVTFVLLSNAEVNTK